MDQICLIVEGRSDKEKLSRIVASHIHIICTNGTKDEEALIELLEPFEGSVLFTFFDRDKSGEYLRKQMRRVYSEATQLMLPAPFIEVAETPEVVLRPILKKVKIDLK